MSEVKIGGWPLTGLARQTGDTVTQSEDGTWVARIIYRCAWLQVMALAPRRNVSKHPDFPTLICNGCQITRLKPGIVAELAASYRGFFNRPDDPDTLPNSTEEIVTSMSDAPIETNPRFVSTLGGTKASPKNGAVFDDDGKFTGWKSDSRYAGKESYLVASTIYRKTDPSRSSPKTVGNVGTIQSPGVGGGPSGATWLFTGQTWRRDGGVYEVTKEYMLSGPGGWDDTIYG